MSSILDKITFNKKEFYIIKLESIIYRYFSVYNQIYGSRKTYSLKTGDIIYVNDVILDETNNVKNIWLDISFIKNYESYI